MANLNLEPGDATFDDMIAGIERGVLMETNCSWSIDDSRNKFQFGCERGRLIENGKLGAVVKNPNYRGISATFWRSLARVGNADTVQVLGSPHCGKGEPSQVIRVGHASPACVFKDVACSAGKNESMARGESPDRPRPRWRPISTTLPPCSTGSSWPAKRIRRTFRPKRRTSCG